MVDENEYRASNLHTSIELERFTTRSASMSIPPPIEYDESEEAVLFHTGPLRNQRNPLFIPMSGPLCGLNQKSSRNVFGSNHSKQRNKFHAVTPEEIGRRDQSDISASERNDHLLKSGPLAICSNPNCVVCPGAYKTEPSGYKQSISLKNRLHKNIYEDVDGWLEKFHNLFDSYFPIMNPHTKRVQQWNKFFVISCLVAIFIDPLFFFLLSVRQVDKCIVLDWSLATTIAVVRSLTDFFYLLHMLLQFRLAYVAPESRVVGAGDLVVEPKKIAFHYLRGYFIIDLFVVLPLPQLMILVLIPKYVGTSSANYAKNLLRTIILLQYIPRIFRFLPQLAGQSAGGFIFESAWANFVINLLMFVLAGHVVGSCWYLFGLQRVNQCLRDACYLSNITDCQWFIDCGRRPHIIRFDTYPTWADWKNDSFSSDCFNSDGGHFDYGIYQQAVNLTARHSIVTRYIYSLFWGFQQISTLAGNLVPSYFEWEVLFTMAIVGLGLLLFALLIGNMQNFLQALGRRKLEMQLRRRDVEQWMSHRRMPEQLKRQVRQAERFSWAATRGINEEELIECLPEDIQIDVRRHYFQFIKKVRIFTRMDEPFLDAICAKLRQKLYIQGSNVLYKGGQIETMIFIVRGKMESVGADGNTSPLSEGDVCGEELLTWYLEYSSVNKGWSNVRRTLKPLHSMFQILKKSLQHSHGTYGTRVFGE
ncbi:Voltage-gated potassium channels domain-containing protein [Dioscorea alata]|uniref:Voltage-gated potassium channels domain-containing protein n=1 Tax=Dioscorea alata TaxID=55571 RepID=A0ACB7U770_DIOAL|nr:Voltage-gated potassium channels domain-containing protein [Dioscorea alata]